MKGENNCSVKLLTYYLMPFRSDNGFIPTTNKELFQTLNHSILSNVHYLVFQDKSEITMSN